MGPALEVEQLYVGPTGKVKTNIFANIVVVEGVVLGNVTAESRVLLLSTARVLGDLSTPELIIQDGVILDGQCSIGRMHGDSARRFIRALYENRGDRSNAPQAGWRSFSRRQAANQPCQSRSSSCTMSGWSCDRS